MKQLNVVMFYKFNISVVCQLRCSQIEPTSVLNANNMQSLIYVVCNY